MNERDYLSQRAERCAGAIGTLDDPIRKHEPDGIGSEPMRGQISEAANLALEFCADIVSPESYGHAVPVEVVKRAARILAMLKPTGPGYTEPPPARCEFCDSE